MQWPALCLSQWRIYEGVPLAPPPFEKQIESPSPRTEKISKSAPPFCNLLDPPLFRCWKCNWSCHQLIFSQAQETTRFRSIHSQMKQITPLYIIISVSFRGLFDFVYSTFEPWRFLHWTRNFFCRTVTMDFPCPFNNFYWECSFQQKDCMGSIAVHYISC